MKKRQLLVATANEGKLRELRDMLADLPFALAALSDFPGIRAIAETGTTFVENASLKATGYAKQTGLLTLADDSGLEIDALQGAPGVLSARYLSDNASYADRIEALLHHLENTPANDRRGRFVCVIAISDETGEALHVSRGTCEGSIALAPRGSGGFGYDPIFVPDGFGHTFAELPAAIKNEISHRARALAGAQKFLHRLTHG